MFDSGSLKLNITTFEPLEDFPQGVAIIAPQCIKQVFYDHIKDKKAKDEGVGNFKQCLEKRVTCAPERLRSSTLFAWQKYLKGKTYFGGNYIKGKNFRRSNTCHCSVPTRLNELTPFKGNACLEALQPDLFVSSPSTGVSLSFFQFLSAPSPIW